MGYKTVFLAAYFLASPVLKYNITDVSKEALPLDKLINNSMDVQSADLDGDGDIDLVVAMEFKPNIVLFNDGHGKFFYNPATLPQKSHDTEDIALADFDEDGDLDIIFVSEDDEIHEYYLNEGKGNFTDVSDRIPVHSVCNAVVAGDFDKDGDIDLVLGNAGQEIFLANDGKGNFSNETTGRMPPDISVTQDVEAADIDGDADLDLVIGNEDGNKIYINDGKGHFKDETIIRLPYANEETRKVDMADIDGDGDPDIFFSNVDFTQSKNIANRLLVNNGKGIYTDETTKLFLAANDMHTADACFSDLDGDDDPDLVLGNLVNGYIQVCLNNGKGQFTEVTDSIFPQRLYGEAISVHVKDLNGDRVPDIYFGMFRSSDRLFIGNR
ncbi:MAG: VCBS repeat-containing protein [Ferruginibacter sp.]